MQVSASTAARGDGAIDDSRGPLRLTAKAAAFVGGPLFLLGVLLHPARDGEGGRAAGQVYGITHDMQAIGLPLQAIGLISIYVLGTREFGRRGLLAVYAAVVGTLLWLAVILGDGLVNPMTARYAPERVHNAADLDVGAMIIAVPATFLFPVGYVVLARLLARHGSKWPGLLTAIGAVVYVIGGMSLLAFGPHSPVIQVVGVAGAVPCALGFVLLGVRPETRPRDLVLRWPRSKEPPSTGLSVFNIRAGRSAEACLGVPACGEWRAGDGSHERQRSGWAFRPHP